MTAYPPPKVLGHAIAAAECLAPERPRVLLIADMALPDSSPRLWVLAYDEAGMPILMQTRVASGSGSDPRGIGTPTRFSNDPHSHETSLGLYVVGERFRTRTWRYRLIGLSPTDSNAYTRDILLHPADYVNVAHVGDSEGCPAVSMPAFKQLEAIGMADAYLWIDGPGVAAPTCG